MTEQANEWLGGVMAAVLTPLNGDLSPDHSAWLDHCRTLLDQGCHGLAVLGTTSEANSLSLTERLGLLDAIGNSEIPGKRLVPGTGCCAIPETVELTRKALEIGSAAVLMLPPFYYKPVSDAGLLAAYSEVIERVGDSKLRVLLYHIPQNTGVALSVDLIAMLRDRYPDTVIGIKDSAGDFANMSAMCAAFPGFRVFSGSDALLLDVLRAGGAGSITACNNVCAWLSAEVFEQWQDDAADSLQSDLTAVRETIAAFPLIEALKEIMAARSVNPSWRTLRPPLLPLDGALRKQLFAALSETAIGALEVIPDAPA